MTAVCKFKGSFSRERLWGIFKHFDVDDSDAITIDDIQKAMEKWEIDVNKEELSLMMKKHDHDHDNLIDFEDFIRIFIQDPKELLKLKVSNEPL